MLAELERDLEAVVYDAVRARYPERCYQRDQIAGELALSWLQARPNAVEHLELGLTYGAGEQDAKRLAEVSVLWDQVEEILTEIEMSFPSNLSVEQKAKAWRHQPSGRLVEKKDLDDSLSLEALSRSAWIYLRAKWADSPMLECWLVRQMIYAETFAFSREASVPLQVNSAAFWWTFAKNTVKWLIGVFVAFSVADVHGPALGVLTYLAWVCMVHLLGRDGLKLKMQLLKIHAQMHTAYRVAVRSTTYPIEVERHVALAEEQGAVWPEGLRPLLQKATDRRAVAWVQRTEY